jgi:hypothetical protein
VCMDLKDVRSSGPVSEFWRNEKVLSLDSNPSVNRALCPIALLLLSVTGAAMAQAVSRQPLTAEAWVRLQVSPCGICGG